MASPCVSFDAHRGTARHSVQEGCRQPVLPALWRVLARAAPAVPCVPAGISNKPGAGELLAADFDRDNRNDIAVTGGGSLSIFYGKGDGPIRGPVTAALGDGLGQMIA